MRSRNRALATAAAAGSALAAHQVASLYRSLDPETSHDELLIASTPDGWQLALHHFRPVRQTSDTAIVMGHGFAGSHMIFDLSPQASLARTLAEAGWPVYCIDLRGRGLSWPTGSADPSLQWTFDDFVYRDLPTAITAACDHAAVESAAWVGLEMSGQAFYAAAIEKLSPQLIGGVTIGSPAVTTPDAKVPGITSAPKARSKGRVPFRAGATAAGPLLAITRSPVLESSFRPSHTDPLVTARYMRHGVPDEASAIADQFTDWMDNATMRSVDHSIVWSERLDEVTLPTMLIAGVRDQQRPLAGVEATFRALGSQKKELVVAGKAHGFSVDYGHDDLLGGRPSADEIYPRITNWLAGL